MTFYSFIPNLFVGANYVSQPPKAEAVSEQIFFGGTGSTHISLGWRPILAKLFFTTVGMVSVGLVYP